MSTTKATFPITKQDFAISDCEVQTIDLSTTSLEVSKLEGNPKETNASIDGGEVENYTRFNEFQRKLYLSLAAMTGLMAPMASTIYFPALLAIQTDFQTTSSLIDLTVSSFIFIIALAPLGWGGASDMYGRRYVYLISQLIFCLSCVGCALSSSVEMFIAMRVFQGIGSSAPLVVGIGTISDIYPRSDRGFALGLFFVGPLIGPVLGPILGGFLTRYVGWRSIFWLMTLLSGLVVVVAFFFLKETLPLGRRKPFFLQFDFQRFKLRLSGPLFNPLKPIGYLVYPNVALGCIYAAIIFASYYLASVTQNRAMNFNYQLDPSTTGLTFLALGLGNIVGTLFGGRFSDWNLHRRTRQNNNLPPGPSVRLEYLWIGGLAIALGLILNGWFIQFKIHLAATLFAQFLIGFGMCNVFGGLSTYLVDLFPTFGASITALSNCIRMLGAAIIISLASLMIDTLDFGYTFTIFALLQIPGFAILFILKKFMERLSKPLI